MPDSCHLLTWLFSIRSAVFIIKFRIGISVANLKKFVTIEIYRRQRHYNWNFCLEYDSRFVIFNRKMFTRLTPGVRSNITDSLPQLFHINCSLALFGFIFDIFPIPTGEWFPRPSKSLVKFCESPIITNYVMQFPNTKKDQHFVVVVVGWAISMSSYYLTSYRSARR